MNRRANIIFLFLSIYVVLQFIWWAFQLVQLNLTLDDSSENQHRIIAMIVGEGSVFILILAIGLWQIKKAIQKEIELSNRQSNFLLSITHELKTPLAANKLAFQTLLKRNLDEDIKNDLIKNALLESERLETLIDNLLNASRIENKALTPSFTKENLSQIIGSLVRNTIKLHPKRSIQCQVSGEISISIDKYMIYMVLNNLLENAIKYSTNESVIEIEASQKKQNVLIEIRDHGIGINKGDVELIFNKFYRAGNENTRQKAGSGLGLYISHEFVKLHSGKLDYRPNNPNGSIFTITLPNG